MGNVFLINQLELIVVNDMRGSKAVILGPLVPVCKHIGSEVEATILARFAVLEYKGLDVVVFFPTVQASPKTQL